MKRKKKLKKGINSIGEEINLHEQKIKKAKEEENYELVEYYDKEIKGLKEAKERKEKQLAKSKD